MIYNLAQYLITNFPLYNFVVNGSAISSAEDVIDVLDNGGDDSHYIDRQDAAVQIMSRSQVSKTASSVMINDIYNLIKNVFGLTLPAVTVDGVLYPEVKTWRIVPVQRPGYIGSDEVGRFLYSFNVTITIS